MYPNELLFQLTVNMIFVVAESSVGKIDSSVVALEVTGMAIVWQSLLTPLHSEQPKLCGVLAVLSAIGLKK